MIYSLRISLRVSWRIYIKEQIAVLSRNGKSNDSEASYIVNQEKESNQCRCDSDNVSHTRMYSPYKDITIANTL